jgi:hypothetical protein
MVGSMGRVGAAGDNAAAGMSGSAITGKESAEKSATECSRAG